MTPDELSALAISLKVAAVALALAAAPGVAIGVWLARSRSRLAPLAESLVLAPLLFPPVVTGLVLLLLLSPQGPIGRLLEAAFGWQIPLTWPAAAIAASVVSLPLLVQSVRLGVAGVDREIEGVARTLGASRLRVFLTITVPLAWRGIAAGLLLAFCKALGEFGATLVVAGNIPGKTQTLSLLLFQLAETGHDAAALRVVGIVSVLSIAVVAAASWVRRWSSN